MLLLFLDTLNIFYITILKLIRRVHQFERRDWNK
jgi:hypothetical protein